MLNEAELETKDRSKHTPILAAVFFIPNKFDPHYRRSSLKSSSAQRPKYRPSPAA